MKAIILAAGQGSRLRPLTEKLPKTLVEVEKKPILGYQIDALLANGISDIVICTGHCGERIVEYCAKAYPKISFRFVHNEEYLTSNNMYSLFLAREHLDGELFLMNGDVVIEQGIIGGMKALRGSAVAVDVGRYVGESMKVVLDAHGMIVDISKKIARPDASGSSIDVYRFDADASALLRKEIERFIKRKGKQQWTEVLLQELFASKRLRARPYDIDGALWWEVDDGVDLEIARNLFHAGPAILKKKKVFFLDGDGTLFVGDTLISGAQEFLASLQKSGKSAYVLSNNTSKTPEEYAKKLAKLGLRIPKERIVLPTAALIAFLKRERIRRIFPLANAKVTAQIRKAGFVIDAEKPQAVVLTYDTEIDYGKIRIAARHLHSGVRYLATHIDQVCPTETGPIPDIGTFITMLETATGRRPERTFGKPSPEMVASTLRSLKYKPSDAVVVGDRLYTDIRMGRDAGIYSVLVLSGESTDDDVKGGEVKPDIVVQSIGRIARFLGT